jgi:hypothetical protein
MKRRSFACGAIVAVLAVPSGRAQDAAAKILEAEYALGMIRGVQRIDAIATMEYWGAGTASAGAVNYHASVSYAVPAMRIDVTTGTTRQIQVVSRGYSWNESVPGAGFIPGTTATPAPAASKVRLLQLWTTPFGVLKAATMAGVNAKVTTEAGATVIATPLPDPLSDVTAKVTLNAKKQVERVETRSGDPAERELNTDTVYSDYKDISEVPTDVLFPTHIVQKVNGSTALDLTINKTDTANPYVVFPVPDNVESIGRP